MKLKKRFSLTPLPYFIGFLFTIVTITACSGENVPRTTSFDRLTRESVGQMTLPAETDGFSKDITFLGLTDNYVIYQDNASHLIYNSSFSGKPAQMTLALNNTAYATALPNGLLVTELGNSAVNMVIQGKAGLENAPVTPLPAPYKEGETCVGQNTQWLYFTTPEDGAVKLFRLPMNASTDTPWEELAGLPNVTGNCFRMAFQSNGTDVCLFLFTTDNIYTYNIRLRQWSSRDNACESLAQTDGAYGKGAGHIVLTNKNGNAIFLYNTITNAFSSLEAGANTKPCFGVQVWNDQLFTCSYEKTTNKIYVDSLNIVKVKNGFAVWDIVVLILYFAVLVFIGYYYSKRQKSPDDYFKGGHRIPWWAAGLSLFGTSLSAITFMAIPAKAYATDWSYMLFNSGIVLVAPIIMFVFIPFFRKLNITTAYQYLEIRFNALIRVICSLAFIVFQVGRMGVILLLPALAINVVTGFNIFLCVGLMGVFSIIYTRMGGIEAVVWTDALQVVILLGGALFAIFHIVGQIPGGWSETINVAVSNGKLSFGSTSFDLTNAGMWTVLIATVFTNLTTYGTDQSMVQRYLTTKSQQAARKSVMTNAILVIPATIVFFLIGTVLFVYYKTNPGLATATLDSNDSIFPWYIYTSLPKGMVGMLIAGIFAAAMSTLSGSMNSAATAYITDIRPKLFKNKPQATLRTAKGATLTIGAISLCFAFLMATWNINSLWDEFNKLLGLILGSMGGLFLLGMVTKRANSQGALIGMAISIAVQAVVAAYTPINLLLYTTVGFITCFVVGYIASLFFQTKTSIKND